MSRTNERAGRIGGLLLSLMLAFGCEAPERAALRLTVVGIDGADWQVIDPLLAEGQLPTLGGLIERGTRAPLRSELPLASAAIWTTIASGVGRRVHGIPGFLMGGRLISSADRRAHTLWTHASRAGLRSAVLGMWATFPAEPIEGVVISERAFKSRESSLRPLADSTIGEPMHARLAHPPEALERLASELAGDPPPEALSESELSAWNMRAEDTAIARSTLRIREAFGPFDLELLLLRGVDVVSHYYWRYHEPDAAAYTPAERPSAEEVEVYGDRIRDHYRLVDGLLAELLEGLSRDHVVVLLSDHGFEAGRQRFRTGTILSGTHKSWNAIHGIFVAAGGPIREGARLDPLSIYDITPTLLHLLGLPVPRDLPGRVMKALFDPAWIERHPLRRSAPIPFEALVPPSGALESPADEKLEAELRALGYIE